MQPPPMDITSVHPRFNVPEEYSNRTLFFSLFGSHFPSGDARLLTREWIKDFNGLTWRRIDVQYLHIREPHGHKLHEIVWLQSGLCIA